MMVLRGERLQVLNYIFYLLKQKGSKMIDRIAEFNNTGITLSKHKIVNVQIPNPENGIARCAVVGYVGEAEIAAGKAGLTEATIQVAFDNALPLLPQLEAYVVAMPVFPPPKTDNLPQRAQ